MTPSEFRRIRRGTLDMTQGQLADALGLSARTIVNIETAREPVDTYYALAIKYLAERSRVTAE